MARAAADRQGGNQDREVRVALSSQEQRIWDDVLLFWAEEVEEPPRAAPDRSERSWQEPGDPPFAVVAGVWITPVLVIFGAMTAAVALGVATAVGWALWHHWPRLIRDRTRARPEPPG